MTAQEPPTIVAVRAAREVHATVCQGESSVEMER